MHGIKETIVLSNDTETNKNAQLNLIFSVLPSIDQIIHDNNDMVPCLMRIDGLYLKYFPAIQVRSNKILDEVRLIVERKYNAYSITSAITEDALLQILDYILRSYGRYSVKLSNFGLPQRIEWILTLFNNFHDDYNYRIQGERIYKITKNNEEILKETEKLGNHDVTTLVRAWQRVGVTYRERMDILKNIHRMFFDGSKADQLKNALGTALPATFFAFIQSGKVKFSLHSKDQTGKIIPEEEKRYATEEELQIFFDFALTLVRFAKSRGIIK